MKKIIKNIDGTALIEFALILPIILLLTFPMIDYARHVLLQQKVIKAAYVIGDSVTMSRPIEVSTSIDDINTDSTYLTEKLFNNSQGADLMSALPTLMLPFREADGEDYWQAIITHVRKPAGSDPVVTWQYNEDTMSFEASEYDADTNPHGSDISSGAGFNRSDPANLPESLVNIMQDGDELIVVEVSGFHRPITPVLSALGIPVLTDERLRYTSFMRSRYGSLQYMWQNNCPPTSTQCPDGAWIP